MRHTRVYLLVKFRHHFNHNSLSVADVFDLQQASVCFQFERPNFREPRNTSRYFRRLPMASESIKRLQSCSLADLRLFKFAADSEPVICIRRHNVGFALAKCTVCLASSTVVIQCMCVYTSLGTV